jgi:hypothetical protein
VLGETDTAPKREDAPADPDATVAFDAPGATEVGPAVPSAGETALPAPMEPGQTVRRIPRPRPDGSVAPPLPAAQPPATAAPPPRRLRPEPGAGAARLLGEAPPARRPVLAVWGPRLAALLLVVLLLLALALIVRGLL